MDKSRNIPEYSLDIIKTAIATIKATSSEMEELKSDLQNIIAAIESNSKEKAITCNKKICAKYPAIFNVAERYELCQISEVALQDITQVVQIMILYRIAHYLRDRLTFETIKTKGEVIAKEVTKSVLGYAAKQLFQNK